MIEVRGRLGFTDNRHFSLIDYGDDPPYALLRGFPSTEEIEASEGYPTFRMLDVCFSGVTRIACWCSLGPIHLRHPTDAERAALEERVGRIRYDNVYLLKPDSIDHHIIATRVHWAEYDLHLGDPSPLVSEDPEYREAHPPIGGPVQFAD